MEATEAVDFFIDAVEQIPSESWDLPSNLEGWSISDLTAPTVGLSIHTWDVYRSQHRPVELPDALLAFGEQAAASAPEGTLRQPGAFGPAQPVPEGASPTARLMAFFGRQVG